MTQDEPYLSNSDHSDTEGEGEEEQPQPVSRGLPTGPNIIDDPNVDEIDADEELTAGLDDDTDYIELIHLKIRSMDDLQLSRFTHLKALILRQNLLESIGYIKHVSDEIEEFDVYDNRIKHISQHLNDKVNLKNLDLSFNKIKTIKNIDRLVQLENLYFVQNKISEIVGLDKMIVLKNLELGGNRIEKIENLDKLQSLEQLWLGKNRIRKFENLGALKNLKILSIQSNRLTRLEGLEELENLEELYVSHNGLDKIEGLEKNLKLTTLDITGNKIVKMENLSHLSELTDLWASSNKFESFEDVEDELKGLSKLETLYLEGNPLQLKNMTSYRRKLIMFLPQLEKIDATYVK